MKSISFSDEMMRALLDGRKTVTRRLMKRQAGVRVWIPESLNTPKEWRRQACLGPGHHTEPDMWCLFNVGDAAGAVPYTGRKSPYRPGETVYVKEAWGAIDLESGYALRYQPQSKDGVEVVYRVGCDDFTDSLVHKWFPPATMPEWASRLRLVIASVGAERVRDITEDEAVKEGANGPMPTMTGGEIGESGPPSFVHGFREIWDHLYPGSWERNDWVWRIELRKEVDHADK